LRGRPPGLPFCLGCSLFTDLPYWRGRFLYCVFYFTTPTLFCQGLTRQLLG